MLSLILSSVLLRGGDAAVCRWGDRSCVVTARVWTVGEDAGAARDRRVEPAVFDQAGLRFVIARRSSHHHRHGEANETVEKTRRSC